MIIFVKMSSIGTFIIVPNYFEKRKPVAQGIGVRIAVVIKNHSLLPHKLWRELAMNQFFTIKRIN